MISTLRTIFLLVALAVTALAAPATPTAAPTEPPTVADVEFVADGYKLSVIYAWAIPTPPFYEIVAEPWELELCPGTEADCWAAFEEWAQGKYDNEGKVLGAFWPGLSSGPVVCD